MLNLTAASAAATVIAILDFQGRAVHLVGGRGNDFIAVQAFEANTVVTNQQWQLQSSSTDRGGPFAIINNAGREILSYPSANAPSGVVSGQQTMIHASAVTTWNITPVATGFHFIESVTGLALTSWAANPATAVPSNPLTLETLETENAQQVFTVETL